MKAAFIIDPLDSLDTAVDTSLGLMQAAHERGVEVWATEAQLLEVAGGQARALARPWPSGEVQRIWLDDMAAIFMRTEPPLDKVYVAATFILDLVDPLRTAMVNDPRGLRALSEHLFPLQFPDLIPPTIVSADEQVLRSFVDEEKVAVIKPVDGYSGRGVFRLESADPNLASLLETCTHRGRRPVMAQSFLPEVTYGNKRLFVVDGEPVGAVYRYPAPGHFRIGPPSAIAEVSSNDRAICGRLAPALRAHGLRLAGLDIIGHRLIEVNITSPGAMRKADARLDTSLCPEILEMLL
jgi:glutathione synthase